MQPGNIFNIPNFLKEKTPIKLQQAMLKLNASKGKEYKYFNIQYVNGYWYAWYFESVEDQIKGAK